MKNSKHGTMKSCKKCQAIKIVRGDQSGQRTILSPITSITLKTLKTLNVAHLAGAGTSTITTAPVVSTPTSTTAPTTTSTTAPTVPVSREKYALLLEGPVVTSGVSLSGHVTTANKMANLLRQKYGYVVDVCNGASTSALNGASASQLKILYQKFMVHVAKPGTTGLLGYVGHGSQLQATSSTTTALSREQWDFGCISDQQLSTDLGNNIAEGSQVILIDDSCFSDGMIDIPYLCGSHALRGSLAFFSAARSDGPDGSRSALFDFDGGVMTTGIFQALEAIGNEEKSSALPALSVAVGQVYKRLLKDLYNTTSTGSSSSSGSSAQTLPLYLPLLTIYPTPTADGLDIDDTGIHF